MQRGKQQGELGADARALKIEHLSWDRNGKRKAVGNGELQWQHLYMNIGS